MKNEPGKPLDIKITAVGMAYSWNDFVDKIPGWLQENPNCKINLSILLVNPEYLDRLPIGKTPRDWAQESRNRILDMEKLVNCLTEEQKNNLSCVIKNYEEIPQYHGILINNDQLFLGRTDWKLDRPGRSPELTVGQNRYRYFNRNTTQEEDRGSERVGLFLNWHRYYCEYNSNKIIEFENGIKKL